MYLLIRLPLACLIIMVYTFSYYRARKRLQTRSSRAFEVLVTATLVHLLAATVTEYTVNRRDRVSELFNYVWHIIFLLSITALCALLYYYVLLYVERGTGVHRRRDLIALGAVVAVSAAGEILLPIDYIDTPQGSYSLGPKAYALYVVVVYTMVMTAATVLRYRKAIGREKSNVLLASVGIFVAVCVIQIGFPYLLLTSPAVTTIVLGIMVNTEDAHLYVDSRTDFYNELGCEELIQEHLFFKEPFRIAVYAFLGEESRIRRAMDDVRDQLPEKTTRVICGNMSDTVMVVIPLHRWMGGTIRLPHDLPAAPEDGEGLRCVRELLSFDGSQSVDDIQAAVRAVKERHEANVLQRDELTGLLRRAGFLKQAEYLLNAQEPFTLLMVDMDDLKHINDTYGHSTGDRALQFMADAFRATFRASDVLCRMGGDEFSIILAGAADRARVREIIERLDGYLEMHNILRAEGERIRFSAGARIRGSTEESASFDTLYAQADAALYRAKCDGKGRLAFWSEDM